MLFVVWDMVTNWAVTSSDNSDAYLISCAGYTIMSTMKLFERRIYSQLFDWKRRLAGKYALLLEGMRRVGKTCVLKRFAESEYKSSCVHGFLHIGVAKEGGWIAWDCLGLSHLYRTGDG